MGDRATLHITSRLLETLDNHELSAVVAHELSTWPKGLGSSDVRCQRSRDSDAWFRAVL